MRVAIDLLHPAHVHFFKNLIAILVARGDQVLLTARRKDITIELLDQLHLPYETISTLGKGKAGLFIEMITRDIRLYRRVRKFQPDVLTGITGVCAAQVSFFIRRPSVVWDDTELQHNTHRLTYPFATQYQSPSCYRHRLGPKQVLYDGYHELAYLHPNRFTADPQVLRDAGIDPAQRISVVRFVGWGALHDQNLRGFSLAGKKRLVDTLARSSRVYITSEAPLPDFFEPYRIALPSAKIHHLLAFADLCAGESATMASETVVLGGTAIYLDPVGRGYTDEEEHRYQMCWNFNEKQEDQAIAKAAELMACPSARAAVAPNWKRLLADKIDVTAYQLEVLERAAAGR
jgi:uncharacterized protein